MSSESEIDWSIFDRRYPVRDGIVMALEKELDYDVAPNLEARSFFDVHSEVMKGREGQAFLNDKAAMARLQKEFYDRMAVGFQHMDDEDIKHGGVFWWKIWRIARYDEKHFAKPRVLFVGAGNCRIARIYAQMGYDVVATDISVNMLKEGKSVNDRLKVKMTYVAANAELGYPFKSEVFDTAYSSCVMNHIVDWRNYISEKMRCLKKGRILFERLPNASKWSFWRLQGELYEGVEIKAKYCSPDTVREFLDSVGLQAKVWTHDRQTNIDAFRIGNLPGNVRVKVSKILYDLRSRFEDNVLLCVHDDSSGIYTLFKIVK